MKRALTYIVFFDVLFIFFLAISGLFDGIAGGTIYYLAFLVPIISAVILARKTGLSNSFPCLKISSSGLFMTLSVAFPVFCLVFFISWLTSLILSRFGGTGAVSAEGNIILVIFTHAVLTAVLEELLFRYIPLAYLAPYSKRYAVIFSALFFALAHCNLFQMPYAFLAGVVFAVLDIAFDSILPSLILHFGNNLISIIWLRGASDSAFVTSYILVILSIGVLSLIPIFIMRKKYFSVFTAVFKNGEGKCREFGITPLILAVLALCVAVTGF